MPSKKSSRKNSNRISSLTSRSDLITFSSSSTKTNCSHASSDKEPTEESSSYIASSSSSSIKTSRSYVISKKNSTNNNVVNDNNPLFETNNHRIAGGQEFSKDLRRLETVINIMEENLQKFDKKLLDLQKKRDHLLLLRNLIKHDKLLNELSIIDRSDVELYMEAIDRNLFSVNLFLSQSEHKDSLLRINELINSMISLDLKKSYQYCKEYLKACEEKKSNKSISNIFTRIEDEIETINDKDHTYRAIIRTEFEALLTGCTTNDRKNIRERLLAIIKHLEFQISKDD